MHRFYTKSIKIVINGSKDNNYVRILKYEDYKWYIMIKKYKYEDKYIK